MDKYFPTVIIGVGGTGSRIAGRLRSLVAANPKYRDIVDRVFVFAALDSDQKDMNGLDTDQMTILPENQISLSHGVTTLKAYRRELHYQGRDDEIEAMDRWLYTKTPVFLESDLSTGASQFRMLSRAMWTIGLDFSDLRHRLAAVLSRPLDAQVSGMLYDTNPDVYVVSGIAGGTGSGASILLARWIRRFYQDQHHYPKIKGVLLLPEVFCHSPISAPAYGRLKANGYSYLMELEAINKRHDKVDSTYTGFDYDGLDADAGSEQATLPFDVAMLINQGSPTFGALPYRHNGFEDYERFIAQGLYSRVFADRVAEKTTSHENNLLEDIMGGSHAPGKPTRRYSSFGTSAVVYPKADTVNYLSERMLSTLLDDTWDRLDAQYRRRVEQWEKSQERTLRAEEPPRRYKVFADEVLNNASKPPAEQDPLLYGIYKEVYSEVDENLICSVDQFLAGVTALIEREIGTMLGSESDAWESVDKERLESRLKNEGGKLALKKAVARKTDEIDSAYQRLQTSGYEVEARVYESIFLADERLKDEERPHHDLKKHLNPSMSLLGIRFFASLVLDALDQQETILDEEYRKYEQQILADQQRDWVASVDGPQGVLEAIAMLPRYRAFMTPKEYKRFLDDYVSFTNEHLRALQNSVKLSLQRNLYRRMRDLFGENRDRAGLLGIIYEAMGNLQGDAESRDTSARMDADRNPLADEAWINAIQVYGSARAKEAIWDRIKDGLVGSTDVRSETYSRLASGFLSTWSRVVALSESPTLTLRDEQELADIRENVTEMCRSEFDSYLRTVLERQEEVDLNVVDAIERQARLEGKLSDEDILRYTRDIVRQAVDRARPMVKLQAESQYKLLAFLSYGKDPQGRLRASLQDVVHELGSEVDPSTETENALDPSVAVLSVSRYSFEPNLPAGIAHGPGSLQREYYKLLSSSGASRAEDMIPVFIDKRFPSLLEDFDPSELLQLDRDYAVALATGYFAFDAQKGVFTQQGTIAAREPVEGADSIVTLRMTFSKDYVVRYRASIRAYADRLRRADSLKPNSQNAFYVALHDYATQALSGSIPGAVATDRSDEVLRDVLKALVSLLDEEAPELSAALETAFGPQIDNIRQL